MTLYLTWSLRLSIGASLRSLRDGVLRFGGVGLRRHVDVPPRDWAPVAHLRQVGEPVRGNVECLADEVVERHLQSRAQGIVAKACGGILAPHALDRGVGNAAPRIVWQGLAVADELRHVRRHPDNLGDAP